MEGKELVYYFSFLKDELKSQVFVKSFIKNNILNSLQNNEYINTSARCLQMMLRIDEYRREFVKADGIATIMSALNGKANFQLQYQLVFCLWLLLFLVKKFHAKFDKKNGKTFLFFAFFFALFKLGFFIVSWFIGVCFYGFF